ARERAAGLDLAEPLRERRRVAAPRARVDLERHTIHVLRRESDPPNGDRELRLDAQPPRARRGRFRSCPAARSHEIGELARQPPAPPHLGGEAPAEPDRALEHLWIARLVAAHEGGVDLALAHALGERAQEADAERRRERDDGARVVALLDRA